MTATTKLSWHAVMAKVNQVIANYILDTEGMWKEKAVKGQDRMENQMHRVILEKN